MDNQKQDGTATPATQWLLYAGFGDTAIDAIDALAKAASPRVSVRREDSLDTALAQGQTAPVIVPVAMPLQHLSDLVAKGSAPDAALEQWRGHAEAVLRACRKNRRRVVLLDAGMLQATPADVAIPLGARLGLRFGAVPAPTTSEKAEFAEIQTAIAATALAGDAKALDLADELEAMILGPVSARIPSKEIGRFANDKLNNLEKERDLLRANVVQLLGEMQTLRDTLTQKEETEKKFETITEERDLLRENLRLLHESTETLLAEKEKFSDRPLLKAQCEALERQLSDARESLRQREAVLGAEVLRQTKHLQEETARLSAELQGARDEITSLLSSTSWKVTSPMRAVKRTLTR